MAKITAFPRIRPLVDGNGALTQEASAWAQAVSQGAQTLEGSGSPEGVIEGLIGWDYFDSVAVVFYKKSINGGSTGWVALNS